jgi:plasmid maintenance system antidote protein VapI
LTGPVFGTSPQYWLNLQVAFDPEVAGQEIQPQIEKEVLPPTAAWAESGRTINLATAPSRWGRGA